MTCDDLNTRAFCVLEKRENISVAEINFSARGRAQNRDVRDDRLSQRLIFVSAGHDLTRMISRRVHLAINELIISTRH